MHGTRPVTTLCDRCAPGRGFAAAVVLAAVELPIAVLSAAALPARALPPAPVPATALPAASSPAAAPAVEPSGVPAVGPAPSFHPRDPFAVVHGMTVSCPGVGREWGTDEMVRTLEILRDLGVNWVTIHPYGGLQDDGTVGRSRIDAMYRDPRWLTRAIDEAHRLGLKMMIKPHLAYWGTRFSWRGEIAFDDEASWRRFFDSYEEWILRVARLSREADAFVVGTELDRTVHREEEWRRIIAAVRAELALPLTYSAGWNEYEAVPFWDALDVIAIQSYFPLVDHEGVPAPAELELGWESIMRRLESFARKHDRKILLGELGYNRSLEAAVRPWSYRQHGDPRATRLQVRCLDVALTVVARSDRIVGAFLWKWFPGEVSHGNFLLSAPATREVIARHWRAGAPASR